MTAVSVSIIIDIRTAAAGLAIGNKTGKRYFQQLLKT